MAAAKRTAKSTKKKPARPGDAAMKRLQRRTADLLMAHIAAGRATTKLKAETRKLKADVDAWRDQTGRSDLRATALRQQEGDGEFSCSDCQWIMPSMGRICFLVGCDPEWNNCSYVCFTVPRDPNYPVS